MQQTTIKRWKVAGLLAAAFVALGSLIAGIQVNNHKVCTGVNVEINSPADNFFVSKKEVISVINQVEPVEGLPIAKVNLHTLESRLKNDKWIESAELYFDKDHVLQVRVEEKEPVARIFTTNGSSFYIDTACMHLPLSKSLSARVPMFTNFPSDRNRLSKPDSALMVQVRDVAAFIMADDFWKAQVAQVDITPTGFEMIPTIGNHVVLLGNGEELQEKFDRLYTFYKQVWTKVGLNAFEKIDVQYKGQVVTTKRGAGAIKIDSAQARVAVQDLLTQMRQKDNEAMVVNKPAKDTTANASQVSASASMRTKPAIEKEEKEDKKPVIKKSEPVRKQEQPVPKAVMKRGR